MRYWRDDTFQTLSQAASEARERPAWSFFAEYCSLLERGLRREALTALDRFIPTLEAAVLTDRQEFVSWLLNLAEGSGAERSLIPHPLQFRIIAPTLEEWVTLDPGSSEPHRWLGGYDHLVEALRLNPADQIARRRFVAVALEAARYSGHELPLSYLGDAAADLVLLREAEIEATKLEHADERRLAISEIRTLQANINDYLVHR